MSETPTLTKWVFLRPVVARFCTFRPLKLVYSEPLSHLLPINIKVLHLLPFFFLPTPTPEFLPRYFPRHPISQGNYLGSAFV